MTAEWRRRREFIANPYVDAAGVQWTPVAEFDLRFLDLHALHQPRRGELQHTIQGFKSGRLSGTLQELPLESLQWTLQAHVEQDRVEAYAERRQLTPRPPVRSDIHDIVVIVLNGAHLILDGNHRVCALRLRARETGARMNVPVRLIA